jgi:GTPase SAR1 family protein
MGKKIIFIGTASSGKSTLSTNVFSTIKSAGYNAELVDEFIRRDIQANGPMESIWEQYRTRAKKKEI